MYVLMRAGINRTDLLRLVEDAVEDYLEREHPATVTAYSGGEDRDRTLRS